MKKITKEKKMKSKNVSVIVIPEILLDKIKSLNFRQKSQFDRAYSMVNSIIQSAFNRDFPLDAFIPIPSSYWEILYGSHYNDTLSKLVNNGIVFRDDRYSNSTQNPHCKKYKLNLDYLRGNFKPVYYSNSIKTSIDKNIKLSPKNDFIIDQTLKIFNFVKIDGDQATSIVTHYIASMAYRNKLNFDHEISIRNGIEIINHNGDNYRTTTKNGLNSALNYNYTLIEDKRKYYIQDKEEYCQLKELFIYISYITAAFQIYSKIFFCNRKNVGNRLFHNLTSLPNLLLPCVTINGEKLVSFDLKNSQFTLLADLIECGYFNKYLIRGIETNINYGLKPASSDSYTIKNGTITILSQPKSDFIITIYPYMPPKLLWRISGITNSIPQDIQDFIAAAKSGEFYEVVQERLELPSRSEAKTLMFELLFSSWKFNSEDKNKLRSLFPNLVKVIDAYKKEKGDNQFAIDLQRRESEIFIDHILYTLLKNGIMAVSKHDSILCPKSQQEAAEKIIREILDKELGTYELESEDI